MKLFGKLCFVTGASRGIGFEIAKTFVREGARVLICSRKEEKIKEAAAAIMQLYPTGEIYPYTLNTSHIESIPTFIKDICTTHGIPDVVVNNAAANPYFGPLTGLEWAAFDKTIAVNIKGPLEISRCIVKERTKALKDTPSLSIIHISSIFGLHAAPMQGVYGMTKAALISLTKTMSHEWGTLGVRVNCIAPGLIDTHFASALTSDETLTKAYNSRSALGRYGIPQEISGIAMYLGSDAADYVTGQTFVVDGGYSVG